MNVHAFDTVLQTLSQAKTRWSQTDAAARVRLIDACLRGVEAVADRWIDASLDAKGFPHGGVAELEETFFVVMIARQLHLYKRSLREIVMGKRPQIPGKWSTRPDGRVTAAVLPRDGVGRIITSGLQGEVWFQPGFSAETIRAGQAHAYFGAVMPKLTLILGAGNVSALLSGDFLYKLLVENHVVLLKMNPVNAYLAPLIREAFAPLIDAGVFDVVEGGVEEARYLIGHSLVDELHVTGSDRTYESIVFGTGAVGAANKAACTPIMTKRFTAELGNVTPIIIVPIGWTPDDITNQAQNIASIFATNASFNCLTPRVIITHRAWEHRAAFNAALNDAMAAIPTRTAYYPGAAAAHAAFVAAHPGAVQHGGRENGHLPWTYIEDVSAAHMQDSAFTHESFCSVIAETALDAPTVPAFLDAATQFANDVLWGTLTATLIVPDAAWKDTSIDSALDRAVADLRYGSVNINAHGGIAYQTSITPWGGYRGHNACDIQSGTGIVNNSLMFDEAHIEKSVVRMAFNAPLNRPVSPNVALVRRILDYALQPTLPRLGRVMTSLIRS